MSETTLAPRPPQTVEPIETMRLGGIFLETQFVSHSDDLPRRGGRGPGLSETTDKRQKKKTYPRRGTKALRLTATGCQGRERIDRFLIVSPSDDLHGRAGARLVFNILRRFVWSLQGTDGESRGRGGGKPPTGSTAGFAPILPIPPQVGSDGSVDGDHANLTL